MGKIEKKKNNKNNGGNFGGTNCLPMHCPSRRAIGLLGPVLLQIVEEFGSVGTLAVPVYLVLSTTGGSSPVNIVCRWSCSRSSGAMYVIYADDAFDSLLADVHSRGGFVQCL